MFPSRTALLAMTTTFALPEMRALRVCVAVLRLTAVPRFVTRLMAINANVAFNVFTNYFNRAAQPTIDFPEVEPACAAC